jgi:hypothetical protein
LIHVRFINAYVWYTNHFVDDVPLSAFASRFAFCQIFSQIESRFRLVANIAGNGSADLRSPENEVYFRSWDLVHHQIYKSILDTQKLIKKP